MHKTEANLAHLQQLKSLGVRLEIDDFGTNYSSLSYGAKSVEFDIALEHCLMPAQC